MTNLHVTDAPNTPQLPDGGFGKAFDRFFPWFVSAALGIYALGGSMQETKSLAGEVPKLRQEVANMRGEVTDLKIEIRELTTALQYFASSEQKRRTR